MKRSTTIPIYGGKLTVIVSEDFSKFFPEAVNFHAFAMSDDACNYTILLPPNADQGTIAHEALHVAHMLFEDLMIPLSYHDEPLAYMLQWIVNFVNKGS